MRDIYKVLFLNLIDGVVSMLHNYVQKFLMEYIVLLTK